MKLLPSLLEQNVEKITAKMNYLKNNLESVLKETNQPSLSLSVNFIYPIYASEHNLPMTISPLLTITEASNLKEYPLTVHANYLVTAQELTEAIPIGSSRLVPPGWTMNLYLPTDIYAHFTQSLGKIVKLGAIVFLSKLNQEIIDSLKKEGCMRFSLYGRHLLNHTEVEEVEINTIDNIIKNNLDCEFVLSTEIQELINLVKEYPNVQLCVDQSYWNSKLN
jgi:hypothetical protein